MPKITFIGGGSAKFVREIVIDLLSHPHLRSSEFMLMDIDPVRAMRSERIVRKIIEELSVPSSVSATTRQAEAIAGADYIFITIMVGGLEAYRRDVEIPLRWGISQTVSDTTGIGGVFRIIRTAPVLQSIAIDVLSLAPRAWVLNYANPMSMNVLTLARSGLTKVVGLCHSIQHLYHQIGAWLDIPASDIRYAAGGINHINFYLRVTHHGVDLYPRLLQARERIVTASPAEAVRFDLLEHLGYFPAEGPYHQSEYYPWFRKNSEEVARTGAKAFWGYEIDSENYRRRTEEIEDQIAGRKPIEYVSSVEYGAQIVSALHGGAPEVFYGNVPNRGHLIENLPEDSVVEVPCIADPNGIVAGRVGRIPTQLAAVMQPHTALHDMAVSGTLAKNRRAIYQAVQADPLAAAVLTLNQIRDMTDMMFASNKAYTSDWD